MFINYTPEQLKKLPDNVCQALIENGFTRITSPSYFHAAQPSFYDAAKFNCFVKKVSDGYIHVGVAISRIKDENNTPRVRLGVTLSESDTIYHVRGFYTIMFPWGFVNDSLEWIDQSTEKMTRLRGNINFIPGKLLHPEKARARAFVQMFIAKMRNILWLR